MRTERSRSPKFNIQNSKKVLEILHEDNHVIVVNKKASDIVQADKTQDRTLGDDVKDYLKVKYNKPGDVFLGVVHRLDRPTSGALVFARTSKALTRLNEQFRERNTKKTYWAIVEKEPKEKNATLVHFLKKNEKQNKSYPSLTETPGSKRASLEYKLIDKSDKYFLLEVELHTGRHHQIRSQLSTIGCIIKGDVKYGAKRSNPDGSICLHARYLEINHPTTKDLIKITAPVPNEPIWKFFEERN